MKKAVLKVLLTTFVMIAAFSIIIIFFEIWNLWTVRILLTMIDVFSFSCPGICCAMVYDKEKHKTISTIGILICVLSCLFYLALIWNFMPLDFDADFFMNCIVTTILLPSAFAHVSLLLLIDSKKDSVCLLQKGTVCLILLISAIFLSAFYLHTGINPTLMTILMILALTGTIITPLAHVITKDSKPEVVVPSSNKYEDLARLQSLLQSQALTPEEFEIEKQKILSRP